MSELMRRRWWEEYERWVKRGFYVIRVKDWSRHICIGWKEFTELTGMEKDDVLDKWVAMGDAMVYNDGEWMFLTNRYIGVDYGIGHARGYRRGREVIGIDEV